MADILQNRRKLKLCEKYLQAILGNRKIKIILSGTSLVTMQND